MANEEHLAILKQGVEIWNGWRSRNFIVAIDLSNADLSFANLSNADLSFANLAGVDLFKADLSGAKLGGADLCGAWLVRANLSRSDLSRVQALVTNFNGAKFTGVCLEDWHINSQTELNEVICDYVYLKKEYQDKKLIFKERRPHNSNEIFALGEFTKLFQKSIETVDLIFKNGIDWKAFSYAFRKTQFDNDTLQLAVQSVENKEDGVVVIRISVPADINKNQIYSDFRQSYEFAHKALEAQYQVRIDDKDKEINRLFLLLNQAQEKLGEVPKLMAEQPKVQQNFSGSVYGVAGNVEGNQNIYALEQKQTLAEAAAEIQRLLKQLEENNPTATVKQQQAFVDAAVSPTLKARFLSALQAGWKEAVKEFLDNPYVNVGVAILEGWQEAE
jgi:uncharacterized protein YjbI with pentapeptide repeats